MAFTFADRLGSLFFPFGLTFQRCQACSQAIHFLLRAVVLYFFLGRIHRFSTSGYPEAKASITSQMPATWPPACSQAKTLPGSDFHRLAVDSLQDTLCVGVGGKFTYLKHSDFISFSLPSVKSDSEFSLVIRMWFNARNRKTNQKKTVHMFWEYLPDIIPFYRLTIKTWEIKVAKR